MTNTAGPFDHADGADVAAQVTPATADGTILGPEEVFPDEADEADVLEQGARVTTDEQATPTARKSAGRDADA